MLGLIGAVVLPTFVGVVPLSENDATQVAADAAAVVAETPVDGVAWICSLVPESDPAVDKAAIYAERIRRHVKAFRARSSAPWGVLFQSTVGHGWTPMSPTPWQKVIDARGTEHYKFCPLGKELRAYVARQAKTLAETKPDFFMVDDDTRLITGFNGCYCPLHLAEMKRLTGKAWTRETLQEAMKSDAKLAETYDGLLRDSFVPFMQSIRDAFPEQTPGLFCCCNLDTHHAYEFAKILAAPGQKPVIRLNNAIYVIGNDPQQMPRIISQTAREIADFRGEATVLCETDPCPQNRNSLGAVPLANQMMMSLLEGCDGAKIWLFRSGNSHERKSLDAYRAYLAKTRGLTDGIRALRLRRTGVVIPLPKKRPFAAKLTYDPQDWCTMYFARAGIPFRFGQPGPGDVVALAESDLAYFSDDELRPLLAGRVLLDGAAAIALTRRGFSGLIGVEAKPWTGLRVSGEKYAFATLSGGVAESADLNKHDAKVQVVSTRFYRPSGLSPERTEIGPGSLLFTNEQGGRVFTIAASLPKSRPNLTQWYYYNETRKRAVLAALRELGGAEVLSAYYPDDAETIFETGVAADGANVFVFDNLGIDTLENPKVVFVQTPGKVERLGNDGRWLPVAFDDLGDGRCRLKGTRVETLRPAVFRWLSPLDSMSWIGDGRPAREGADWYKDDPAPIFTAKFVLPKGASNATVRLATPACCFLTVNGETPFGQLPVGVIPQWSPYDKTLYAETFTFPRAKPHPATNEVTLVLGNGWYNMPPLKFWGGIPFREHLPHGRPCFKLAVDGVGPLDWTWRESPLVQNSYQLGEVYDSRLPLDKVAKKAVAVAGPKGKIVPARAPAIGPRLPQGVRGEARWLKEGETQVVDFGVNLTGVFAFALDTAGLKSGDRIEIVYGERLNADGSVNPLTQTAGQIKRAGMGGPGAPDVAMQRDVVIVNGKGGVERLFNATTWHIARYAEIRGCRKLLKGNDASMMPIGSLVECVEPGCSFKSEQEELNRIHEICVRTFLDNLVGVQSDCPGRERLQYGGDITVTCEAMALNFDMKEFYLKTLQDFADEAAGDGWITETAPFVGIADAFGVGQGGKGRQGPISFAVVVPTLMDLVIRHYPDAKDRALKYYPVCTRYVELMDKAFPSGLVPTCIGDHEAIERAPNDCTATAHWHRFLELTAKFAVMLGKTGDQAKYEALAKKVRTAFAAKYVKDGVVANGTQSAQAIGLYLGLVPKDQVAAAEARLVKAIEEKGFGATTGIFSTRYMLMYLAEHGRNDLARKIVLHKGFPGWPYMLERGATTLWETWKESDNVFSNCHPMFGSVDEWILRYSRTMDQ